MATPFIIFRNADNRIIAYGSGETLPQIETGETALLLTQSQIAPLLTALEAGHGFNVSPGNGLSFVEATWVNDPTEPYIDIVIRIEATVPNPSAAELRAERDRRLQECDWTQLPDVALSAASVSDFATYRQALRDVPQQLGFPNTDVIWPTRPAEVND